MGWEVEKEVYVSKIKQENVGKFAKIIIDVFDKNGKTYSFLTSLMTKYNAEKYEASLLKISGKDSWFKVFFGLKPLEFCATLDDDHNEIVTLSNDQAIIYKNEVVFSKICENLKENLHKSVQNCHGNKQKNIRNESKNMQKCAKNMLKNEDFFEKNNNFDFEK